MSDNKATAEDVLRNSRMDEHTLCVYFCVLDEKDILENLFGAIREYENNINRRIKSSHFLNVIRDRQGIPYGYGYLYVSNPEVYYLLLGKNPDGSDRKGVVDHSETSPENVKLLFKENSFEWNQLIEDWSEFSNALEERELDPLVDISNPVYYNSKQKQNLQMFKQRAIQKGKTLQELDYVHNEYAIVECTPAIVKDVDIEYIPNKLFCPVVPEWVSSKVIQAKFQTFVQGKNKNARFYPYVRLDPNKRSCVVEFDHNTRDAQFALLMAKNLTFTHPRRNKEHTLFFSHMKKHHSSACGGKHQFKSSSKRSFSKNYKSNRHEPYRRSKNRR